VRAAFMAGRKNGLGTGIIPFSRAPLRLFLPAAHPPVSCPRRIRAHPARGASARSLEVYPSAL